VRDGAQRGTSEGIREGLRDAFSRTGGGYFVPRIEPSTSMMEDLAKYRGGLALSSKVEEISRALSGGGKFGGTPIDSGGMRVPGGPTGVGYAGTVNQDVDVKIDVSGVKIASPYDAKTLAADIGQQVKGALISARQGAI